MTLAKTDLHVGCLGGKDLIRTPSNAIIRLQLTNRSTISAILRSKVSATLRHFILIFTKGFEEPELVLEDEFFRRGERGSIRKSSGGIFEGIYIAKRHARCINFNVLIDL